MSESIHEIHEHAEKADEEAGRVLATFTNSVMAVLVAISSVWVH